MISIFLFTFVTFTSYSIAVPAPQRGPICYVSPFCVLTRLLCPPCIHTPPVRGVGSGHNPPGLNRPHASGGSGHGVNPAGPNNPPASSGGGNPAGINKPPASGGGNGNNLNPAAFSPSDPTQFSRDTISATNAKRALPGECANPLREDSSLMAAAQAYANKLASTGVFEHSAESKAFKYGENMANQCGGTMNTNTAVDGWYNEKKYFSKGGTIVTDGPTMNAHYTALVWKATTQVGCGVATGANKCTYVVCNYFVLGNVESDVRNQVMC